MAATYVTMAELRTNLGIGTLYSDATVEEVCQSAEDIINSYLWFDDYYATAQKLTNGVCTLYFDNPIGLYVGQTVIVTNAGSKYTGSKTIASMPNHYSITYTANGQSTDEPLHAIRPPARVLATTHIDYATTPAVREASMMIAVDIWQARQAPSGQGASIDGFAPSPFKMGNTLIARVRGLLAPYMAPTAMVG